MAKRFFLILLLFGVVYSISPVLAEEKIDHWVDALIAMNHGQFKEAESFLKSTKDKNAYVKAMLNDMKIVHEVIQLGKDGKYDEAIKSMQDLRKPGRYHALCQILTNNINKAQETGSWPEQNVMPEKLSHISLSPKDTFILIDQGKFDKAQKLLKALNQNDSMNKKVLSKVEKMLTAEQLGREGKYDEARKMVSEVSKEGRLYAKGCSILTAKISQAEKSGTWPTSVEMAAQKPAPTMGGGPGAVALPEYMVKRMYEEIKTIEEKAKSGKYDESLKELQRISKPFNGYFKPECDKVIEKINKAKATGEWPKD